MSLAEDMNQEAASTGSYDYDYGFALWPYYGIPPILDDALLGLTQHRFSLGRSQDFRDGFADAAVADGFDIVPILLSTDFIVDWTDP